MFAFGTDSLHQRGEGEACLKGFCEMAFARLFAQKFKAVLLLIVAPGVGYRVVLLRLSEGSVLRFIVAGCRLSRTL